MQLALIRRDVQFLHQLNCINTRKGLTITYPKGTRHCALSEAYIQTEDWNYRSYLQSMSAVWVAQFALNRKLTHDFCVDAVPEDSVTSIELVVRDNPGCQFSYDSSHCLATSLSVR